MILKETIDEIFLASDIVDVIGEFINLKKIGNNYKGLSPFSNERIPSLIVSPIKKIWKDFSSGKGGNIITFLMEYEKLSYPEALEWLANKYNIDIEKNYQNNIIISEIKKLYNLQELAKIFFIKQLNNPKEKINIGLIYLKNRKIEKYIIKKFELGYAPQEWDAFTKFAILNGYNFNDLEKSGLVIIKNNYKYDRYRNNIIFPIKNINGKIIGFGGRFISNKINNTCKYINSPESIIYYKSKTLYGIYEAKKYISKENFCYIVEGYIDVLSLYQIGIKNVVATLGTFLTKDQILLIKKFTINVIILYDGDLAGIKGSLRIIDILLENDMDIKIINIEKNEDPSSFCNKYNNNIINIKKFFKKNTYNFIQYKINLLSEKNKKDIIKKEKLIKNIIKSISIISNNIKKELYIQELSNTLDINKFFIYNELSLFNNNNIILKKKKFRYNIIDPLILSEETIIKFILNYGNKIIEYKKFNNKNIFKTTVIEEILYQFNIDNIKFTLIFYQNIFNKICEEFKKNKCLPDNIFNKKILFTPLLEDKYNIIKSNKKNINFFPKKINITTHLHEILLRHKSHYISNIINLFINKAKENTDKNMDKIREKILNLTKIKILINKKLNRYV